MDNRQPTRPGRVKFTNPHIINTSGEEISISGLPSEFYARIDMADEPYIQGTKWNKENVLTDETAAAIGEGVVTPNDAFRTLAPSVPGAKNWDSGNLSVISKIWTPRVIGLSNSVNATITISNAKSTKIMDKVSVIFDIVITSISGASGILIVTDIPFAGYGGFSAVASWVGSKPGFIGALSMGINTGFAIFSPLETTLTLQSITVPFRISASFEYFSA